MLMLQKNTQDTLSPKKGDVAFFNYEIKDLREHHYLN
jgi:hypothetical protein